MSEKPAILRESQFTIEEGFLYRAVRTGAIWMNKLFFSGAALLGIWLIMAYAGGVDVCTETPNVVEGPNGTGVDQGTKSTCSVILHPTALYLGAMTILSFVLSIGFGLLGLVVGKNIIESTPAAQEVGAGKTEEE